MKRLLTAALLAVLVHACEVSGAGDKPQVAQAEAITATPAGVPCRLEEGTGGSHIPGIKRTVTVYLSAKTTERDLREMALRIRAAAEMRYQRTFIVYLLPGMKPGAGAWATTHFDPGLEVRILGSTADGDAASVVALDEQGGEVIGTWSWPQIGAVIRILRDDEGFLLTRSFKDGSSGRQRVVDSASATGRRFDPEQPSESGDHWVIDRTGRLELQDSDGLFQTLTPVGE